MGWNATIWPATDNGWTYISHYNDLVNALNEKDAETYGGGPFATKSAGDWIEIGDILDLRSRVEAIIPYFRDPDNEYVNYTKSTCLTAAIGQADWSDAALAANDDRYPRHYNELKDVLNQLKWFALAATAGNRYDRHGQGAQDADDNTAWASVKTAYTAASFAAAGTSLYCGFRAFHQDVSPDHKYTMDNTKTRDITLTLAHGIAVAEAMFKATQNVTATGGIDHVEFVSTTFRVYEGAAWTGTTHDQAIGANGDFFFGSPTLDEDGINYFSVITEPAEPTQDDYRPTAHPKTWKGMLAQLIGCVYRLDWDYAA